MLKVLRFLDNNLEGIIIAFLIAMMSILVAFQVFMRYVMQNSLAWSEELARYCMIWMIYIGTSWAAKESSNIKVDVLNIVLSNKQRIYVTIFSNLVFLIFALLVVYYGYDACYRIARMGQKSPASQLPMWIVYVAVPLGFAMASLRLVQNTFYHVRRLYNPTQEDANAPYTPGAS